MKCIQCGTELGNDFNYTGCLCDNCRMGKPGYNIPLSNWQVCPKCYGQGVMWYSPSQPMNNTFLSDGTSFECDVCKGKKIINIITGQPFD